MKDLTALTNKEWAQCKAALYFWRDMLDYGKTPPFNYKGMDRFFTQDAPMTVEELDELINDMENVPHTFYTTQMLADEIGCAPVTIQSWVQKTKRGFRIGTHRLFTNKDLEAFRKQSNKYKL